MLKKVLIITGIIIIAIVLFLNWFRKDTKKHSPAVATYQHEGLAITVNYCRPFAKNRVIFGDEDAGALQPYGKYWRMGANEATTIELNKKIMFNDKPLDAGKYNIYAYPGKDSWTVCINTDWDRWGAQEADKEKDVFRTTVRVVNDTAFEDQFLISFDKPDTTGQATMNLHWDKTLVRIPIHKL